MLHYYKRGNPIENLYSTLNSDFFEKVSLDYVVLQCVQRQALFRGIHSSSNKVLTFDQMSTFEKEVIENNSSSTEIKLFTDAAIKFPFYNALHTVSDNAFFSKVYKVETDKAMFSVEGSKDLLFMDEEIINLKHSEDIASFDSLNNHLNTLSDLLEEKGIKLITLISPDKYDVHYNHILEKDKYPKPLFFDRFNKLPKRYKNIDSKRLLQKATDNYKDVYFYDDTHWSPIASKIIAEEIFNIVTEK